MTTALRFSGMLYERLPQAQAQQILTNYGKERLFAPLIAGASRATDNNGETEIVILDGQDVVDFLHDAYQLEVPPVLLTRNPKMYVALGLSAKLRQQYRAVLGLLKALQPVSIESFRRKADFDRKVFEFYEAMQAQK